MSAGADGKRIAAKLAALPPRIKAMVDKATRQSGDELVRVAKVLAPSKKTGKVRAGITGTANADGSYLADFGPLSKVIEGGRDDAIASPSGKNIGTTAAQPFVNPALEVTRRKYKARSKRAATKAVKELFNG